MPARIADLPAPDRPARAHRAGGMVRCILDSLAAAFAHGRPRRVAAVRPSRRRRPPRRRRCPERAAVPADRRRLRARRSWPGRSRRRRSATCSSRRAPQGSIAGDLETLRRWSGATERRPAVRATHVGRRGVGHTDPDARRPVHHLLQRRAVPRRRAGDVSAAAPAGASRSSSPRRRRAAARCTSTPATATTCVPLVQPVRRRVRAGSTPSSRRPPSCAAMVRHQHPTVARTGDARHRPGLGRRVATSAARLRVDRVPRRRARRHRRRGRASRTRVAFHPTCHSVRLLGIGDRPRRLLERCDRADARRPADADQCCGFGGTFAVKNADTSRRDGHRQGRRGRGDGRGGPDRRRHVVPDAPRRDAVAARARRSG